MQLPFDVTDTAIEQIIYTWSEVNRGSGAGLGFGAVSPPLRNYAQWFNSWPTSRFQLTVNGLARADLFDGWQQAVTLGSFAIDDINVVYRKMPEAGADAVGRDRFVVHALVGRREVLDLARVAPDSAIWLSAEQCPLNALPTLTSLSPSDLPPRSFAHADDVDDAYARELIGELLRSDNELVLHDQTADAVERLILAIHMIAPTSLWPDVEVTSYLDRSGVTTMATITHRIGRTGQDDRQRLVQARIADCVFHRAIDRQWSTGARSWRDFLSSVALSGSSHTAQAATPAPMRISEADGDVETPRARVCAIVAEVSEASGWNFDRALDDHGLARVLAYPAAEEVIGPWIAEASAPELIAVFGCVHERRSFARVRALVSVPTLATRLLAEAWQRSAAAPLGFALLGRDTSRLREGWAIPEVRAVDHQADATRLIEQLTTSDQGCAACVTLFKGGILQHREWRRAMIEALLASGAKADFVFHQLVVQAGADQSVLLEVALDHIEPFADWLEMPPEYREAFRGVLARPSLLSRLFGMVHP